MKLFDFALVNRAPIAVIFLKSTYSTLPNNSTGSNKRTGGEICQKLISPQDLINAQG